MTPGRETRNCTPTAGVCGFDAADSASFVRVRVGGGRHRDRGLQSSDPGEPAGRALDAPDPNVASAIAAATTARAARRSRLSRRRRPALGTDGEREGRRQRRHGDAAAPSETAALHARLEPLPDLSADNAPRRRCARRRCRRRGRARSSRSRSSSRPASRSPTPRSRPAHGRSRRSPPPQSPAARRGPRRVGDPRSGSPSRWCRSPRSATPAKPPATITPAVAGTWRWIDTRVATFTATGAAAPAGHRLHRHRAGRARRP